MRFPFASSSILSLAATSAVAFVVDGIINNGSIIMMTEATTASVVKAEKLEEEDIHPRLLSLDAPVIDEASSSSDSERIINGEDAKRNDYPWFASARKKPNGEGEHSCGGQLIGPNWVLTAAHCEGIKSVIISDHSIINSSGDIVRNCVDVIKDPTYRRIEDAGRLKSIRNDLALCKLDRPVTGVKPLKIKTEYVEDNTDAINIGLGDTDPTALTKNPTVLKMANVQTLVQSSCDLSFNMKIESNICANKFVYVNGKKDSSTVQVICQGDSGGPLFIKGPDGKHSLIGVSSYSGCKRGGFARVSKVKGGYSFIENTICKKSDKQDSEICGNTRNESESSDYEDITVSPIPTESPTDIETLPPNIDNSEDYAKDFDGDGPECADNPDFEYTIKAKKNGKDVLGNCKFVAEKPKKRCKKKTNDGKKIQDECSATCGQPKCICEDRTTPFKIDDFKGKKLRKRCSNIFIKPSSKLCKIKKVMDECPVSCKVLECFGR